MTKRATCLFATALIFFGTVFGATAQTKSPEAPTLAPKYLNWLNDDVNLIITAKEKEVFLKLQSDKERELFIESFWKQRDPTRITPENEFKVEHYLRLQSADQAFGVPGTPGRKTEAGKAFIIAGWKDAVTNASAAIDSWSMKMRIFEVPGKGGGEPIKAVTSSYLNYKLTATIKTEYDLAEEMKQIQKTFNYTDVKLLTEADFSWKRNRHDRSFHIFRLDGREYLILITPVEVARRLTFRIEVNEQGDKTKSNLLDTEFSIPEKNIAVFGFEDTKGNVYFLSFRVSGWAPAPAGTIVTITASKPSPAGGITGVTYGGVLGGEEPRRPPAEGQALEPVRAVGEIKPPRLIKQVDPIYPEIARQARVEGVVILEAETDFYGRVKNTRILRSIPLLDQAATDAVRQWVYEPMIIDGKPRGVIFTTTVRFQLDGGEGKPAPRKDGESLKITGDVKGPKLIKQVDPVYPEIAKQSKVEGMVILEVNTDIYGRVRDLKVLRSIPLLDQAAIDAVRQWVYEPPIINDKPISLTFTVMVRFALDGGAPKPAGGVMGGVIGGKEGEAGEKVLIEKSEKAFVEAKSMVGGMAAYLSWIRDDAKKPAKDEPAPVRAEGSIQPPKAIKTLNPAYPEGARAAGVQGFVSLETETDPAGKVRRIQSLVFKEEPGLSGMNSVPLIKAAIDAVKQWVYEPLIVDGKPRAAIFTVTVRFTLK